METATVAIAREAARLAFICSRGAWSAFEPGWGFDADSTFEEEKAELVAGIREEVLQGNPPSDLCLDTCRDLLIHLSGAYRGGDSATIH